MINDNCSGFALVTVLIMLVGLITAVLMSTYPLFCEVQEDSRQFITDMKEREIKRAMFGRLADQAGGQFMSCGGYYSDYGNILCITGGGEQQDQFFSKRLQRREGNTYWGAIIFPYHYSREFGFFGGYRGKRYLYPVPTDLWDESEVGYYDGFGNRFTVKGFCLAAERWRHLSSNLKNWMIFATRSFFYFRVRDYTRTPEDKIRLMLVSSKGGCPELAHDPEGPIETKKNAGSGHYLHTFYMWFDTKGCKPRHSHRMGLDKVVIQIEKNGEWVTTFTTAMVLPVYCECYAPGRFCVKYFFVAEVDYHG